MENEKKKINRNKYGMLVDFQDVDKETRWLRCIDALRTDYTLTIREICETLHCTRPWVEQFIRPHVHYIYISPKILDIAGIFLEKSLVDSIWLNRQEFEELVRNNIAFCSRQTIRVPVEYFIDPILLNGFRKWYQSIQNELAACREEMQSLRNFGIITEKLRTYNSLKKSVDKEIAYYALPKWRDLIENRPNRYKRTKTAEYASTIPAFELSDLVSVYDIMEYGDSSEMIYRQIFDLGYYKLILKIPDPYGVLSEKTYYLDPQKLDSQLYGFQLKHSLKVLTVSYDEWMKLQ